MNDIEQITRELEKLYEGKLRQLRRKDNGPRLKISRLISDLSRGSAYGEDSEAVQEYARQAGINHDPQRPYIPFSEFRDLSKGVASAGGYLAGSETPDAVDILRPFSVTARAGITIETGLQGDQVIPRTTTKTTPAWLSTEGSQVTASTPTLQQIACTPKTVAVLVNFSRQLSKQANAENFIRRELLRTIGAAIDSAVISGGGIEQPTGLLSTSIGTETGTSFAQANAVSMKRKVADANAPDEYISFIGTPTVRELLEKRERASGSGFIWDDDKVASRPGYVSTDIPASTLICGAWPSIWLGIWGSGFVIEVNPYDSTGFKSGTIQARILVSMDVCILHPAAFCKAESIT